MLSSRAVLLSSRGSTFLGAVRSPVFLRARQFWFRSRGGNVNSISVSRVFALCTLGATVGAVALFHSARSEENKLVLKDAIPNLTLYQYEKCPFCNKVQAYLDFYKIPYSVVEVNPLFKTQIKFSAYKKVPFVVLTDGTQVNDSSQVIQALHQTLNPNYKETEEEAKWRKWVDDYFVHTLSPNIYRTWGEAFKAFDYLTQYGNFSTWEALPAKFVGAVAMHLLVGKLKARHNITDERQALYDAANLWVDAVGERKFLGGNRPNLADLSVFGVLRSIEGLDAHNEMLSNTKIQPWYLRMKEAVGANSRIPLNNAK